MLADDHVLIREGIKQLLEFDGSMKVIAEASDGIECLEKLKNVKPDILLLDINMLTVPVADGSSVLTQVESAFLRKSIVIDDFQYFFYYMIQLYHYALTPAFPAHV